MGNSVVCEAEIDLCGHATLAASHCVFSLRDIGKKIVGFHQQWVLRPEFMQIK